MKTALPLLLIAILAANLANAYTENAANYITSRQTLDGQFDDLGVFVTAPAITALHALNAKKYHDAIQKGARYIAAQHRANGCISTWCSQNGRIPDETGISLWALAETNNLDLLPKQGRVAIRKIKEAQTSEGDFASDENTNAEHTTWALIALSATNSLTQQEANKAINYIAKHWQEKNGAIKRADNDRSGVNGPQEYYTALTTWALAYANQTNNTVYKLALANLITKSENCFSNSTHVLTIATAKLALDTSNVTNDLETCIWNLQHSNGGFKDSVRASAADNSFDTGFALLANARDDQRNEKSEKKENNEEKTITIKITSGNQTRIYPVACRKAFECLTQVANVTCKWHSTTSLTCPNVEQACFIQQINGEPKNGTQQWSITVNEKLAEKGASCLDVKQGDEIELKLETNFNPYALRVEETQLEKKEEQKDYTLIAIAVLVLLILTTLILKSKKR